MVAYQTAAVVCFRVCEVETQVICDDAVLAGHVRSLFEPYAITVPTRPPNERDLHIVRDGDGWLLQRAGNPDERHASSQELMIVVEYTLAETFLSACGGFAHLHAGGAVRKGRAVLVVGDSGAGKSSLAFSFSVSGLPVLSDDIVLIDDRARATSFRRLFKVVPALLRERGIAPADTPFWEADSDEAWFDPSPVSGWAEAAPVGVLAFVRHQRDAKATLRDVSRFTALERVMNSVRATGLSRARSFERLCELIKHARCLEMTFGGADEGAACLAAMLT